MSDNLPKLGDYVQTTRHGHRGRVTEIDHWCEESDAWFAMQVPPLPESAKKERWFHILCTEPGGAVVVPASDVQVVESFPFVNKWADVYFREES